MALECGDIDVDGTPVITVVANGQWSKRSYRTKYDALSGAVSIKARVCTFFFNLSKHNLLIYI